MTSRRFAALDDQPPVRALLTTIMAGGLVVGLFLVALVLSTGILVDAQEFDSGLELRELKQRSTVYNSTGGVVAVLGRTGLNFGAGLTGGGTSGTVVLAVAYSGTGTTNAAARSNHTHASGSDQANTAIGDAALASVFSAAHCAGVNRPAPTMQIPTERRLCPSTCAPISSRCRPDSIEPSVSIT